MRSASGTSCPAPWGMACAMLGAHDGFGRLEDIPLATAKDDVRELLEHLPEDATLEDIQYHLYVRQKVQRGLDAAAAGRTAPQAEVERRLARWLER